MSGGDVLELISVLIIFVVVLAATYYVTKWIGKSGVVPSKTQNIRVIETFRIAPNKYIQIVQLGSKYYSIGVTKENITFLAPLEEEQLDLTEEGIERPPVKFQDVLKQFGGFNQKHKKEK